MYARKGGSHHHHNSSSMGGILAPESRPALPKDYHKENLMMMRNKELEAQRKREDEMSEAPKEWKLKRY